VNVTSLFTGLDDFLQIFLAIGIEVGSIPLVSEVVFLRHDYRMSRMNTNEGGINTLNI